MPVMTIKLFFMDFPLVAWAIAPSRVILLPAPGRLAIGGINFR
jgi:hypothetical protein